MLIITGGAGFIGSCLIAELERQGWEDIVVADTFGQDDRWRNLAQRGALTFITPQQTQDFIKTHAASIRAVIHLGAISSTTETDIDALVQRNTQYTIQLYTLCRSLHKPFIYASSASVYGDGSQGFNGDTSDAALQNLRPLNPYAWSKLAADRYICHDVRKRPLQSQMVGLRFFNVYGPNEYHKGAQASVMYHFCKQAMETGRIQLFRSYRPDIADGMQQRDFVYVDDCIRVILWLLENPKISGIFNVGSGQARTYQNVAQLIGQSLGREVEIEYIDMPEHLRDHYQYYTQADLTKLRTAGFAAPMTSLEDGVSNYVKNYLMQENKYK